MMADSYCIRLKLYVEFGNRSGNVEMPRIKTRLARETVAIGGNWTHTIDLGVLVR